MPRASRQFECNGIGPEYLIDQQIKISNTGYYRGLNSLSFKVKIITRRKNAKNRNQSTIVSNVGEYLFSDPNLCSGKFKKQCWIRGL